MTAETIIEKYQKEFREKGIVFDLTKPMIEFARQEVMKALTAASEKAKIEKDTFEFGFVGSEPNNYSISKSSILNSYPLNNIK
mgnify:CR=1 FL=1